MADAAEASSPSKGHQTANDEAQSSKGPASAYSGVVAQRALFGPYKRRGIRKFGGRDAKSAPSRLSKVSAADNMTT